MAGKTREVVYDNKHEEVNYFIKRKKMMGRSPRTLNSYNRTLKHFFHDLYPDKSPADITVHDIEEYLITLDERDLSQTRNIGISNR